MSCQKHEWNELKEKEQAELKKTIPDFEVKKEDNGMYIILEKSIDAFGEEDSNIIFTGKEDKLIRLSTAIDKAIPGGYEDG